jgi:outer membrane protein assembly factor BamB
MMQRFALVFLACPLLALAAADWPQWRGPDRTDVSREAGLLKTWPDGGPPLLWTFGETGVGYSGPAVVGDRLYTMGARGATEFLLALDAQTGKEVFATPIGPTFTFKSNVWGDGPRGTPTVDGNRLYALGGQGDLVCVEAADGKEVWRKSLPRELGGEISPNGGGPEKIGWGYCESPLVDGDQVVCTPGGPQGTLAGLDKNSGRVLWRSTELKEPATYSSVVPAEISGQHQYVQQTDRGVVGVARDGRLLWRYPRKPAYADIVIPTPIVRENVVYTAAGYGAGCDLVRIQAADGKLKASKFYANKVMVNDHGGVLLVDDHLYGYSDGKGWVCQELQNGKMVWSEKRKLGRGSLTCADGQLYCYGEDDGTCVLTKATPAGWQETGRLSLPRQSGQRKPNGKVWTHPVVANGRLYLRDQELLFCFDIRDRSARARSGHGDGQ